MRDRVLEALVEAAQNVVDEIAFLHMAAEVAELIGHLLQLGRVFDHREVALHETVKLIAKVGGAGVAVAAEERPEGAPEGTRRVVALLDDFQSRGRHGGVVPGDDGEVVEMPVGGDLRPRAVDVVEQAELGERAEELAAPQPVILLLVVENDQDMITDAKRLDGLGGNGLGCNGQTKVLVGVGTGRGGVGGGAHGRREVGRAAEAMDLRLIQCQNQSEGRRERFCATLDFIDTKITRICSYTAQLNQTRTSRRNRAALTTNPTPLYMQYTRSLTPRRSRVVVRW